MVANDLQYFQQAVEMARAGRKVEAHTILVQLAQFNPDDSNLLLWLAFTSSDLAQSRAFLERLMVLDPSNPSLSSAMDWLKSEEAKHASVWPNPDGTVASPSLAMPPGTPEDDPANRQYYQMGEPVRDGKNFFMTQTGGMLLVAGGIFLVSFGYSLFQLIVFLRGATRGAGREIGLTFSLVYFVVAFFIALISGYFLVISLMDIFTPPVKAQGTVSDRTQKRVDMRDRYGRVYDHDLQYHLDFHAFGYTDRPVHLTLTEDQYQASGYSNLAFIVYSKRTGMVRLYQVLSNRPQ